MKLSECLVRTTVDVIEGKWKPIIVNSLKSGALRFGELRRQIPEATKQVLIGQLRELEQDQIVYRKVSRLKIVRAEYSLTPYGRTLVPVLTLMARWGQKHRTLGLP
jgi:DNA-binding HxlR family transcriptional regulator